MEFKILTYNIHKGFSAGFKKNTLEQIRDSIRRVDADIVCLQEIRGEHPGSFPESQFEYLADQTWPHYAYGKNAVYSMSNHGNAILSKYPIESWENEDVSSSAFERRGVLHAMIRPSGAAPMHILNVHMSLLERDRQSQLEKLSKRIQKSDSVDAPLIIAGDFNDWRGSASQVLENNLGVKEAFKTHSSTLRYAKTFPSIFPILSLDRVYFKNMKCLEVDLCQGKIWRALSDHLPLLVKFRI